MQAIILAFILMTSHKNIYHIPIFEYFLIMNTFVALLFPFENY